MPSWFFRFARSLSIGGLFFGTLFFVASLTPTLIPRTYVTQGVLSGACFAVGYAVGVALRWLWGYMELPEVREKSLFVAKGVVTAICIVIACIFLWRTADGQNSIRVLMGMEPITSAHPLMVSLIAVATFLVLIALARIFLLAHDFIRRRMPRFVPPRVAKVIGFTIAVVVFWTAANGVLFRVGLDFLDASFAARDALLEPERAQPQAAMTVGSPASFVRWGELGRMGRQFIDTVPDAAEIGGLSDREAMEPIRVYVGLRAAETAEERAQLALKEMLRVGAFDRSTLVVITPTGTGWVDPGGIASIEFLHNGDIASVALQYSYLSSPLSLLLEPDHATEAAQALFKVVYSHWTALPHGSRPRLYLHGLSLGAMNSERSAQLFEIIHDPIQGALWSGPPFESGIWRRMTGDRNPGSPAWLPEIRDGATVRFMNQNGSPVPADAPWGPMRILYLQYASDPITFFSMHYLYHRPEWLEEPRGPDVSPKLRWYPFVTMLQLALDMAVGTAIPIGFGHVYAPEHYVDGWLQVTNPQGWSDEQIVRLKAYLAEKFRYSLN